MRAWLIVVLAVVALCQAEEAVQPKLGFPHLGKIDLTKYGISDELLKSILAKVEPVPVPEQQAIPWLDDKIIPLGHVDSELPDHLKAKIVNDAIYL